MDLVVISDYVRSNEIRELVRSNTRLIDLISDWLDFDSDEILFHMLAESEPSVLIIMHPKLRASSDDRQRLPTAYALTGMFSQQCICPPVHE